jgi:hypothetical protein
MQDEDRQTQEAFDTATGQAMALTPPRVEDQEAGQKSRAQPTLESVPFFDRPIGSSPDDRVVGEDEFGRRVYTTKAGTRYTISLNPDQRTRRVRFQEDTLPAVREYIENPTLPTVEQAAGFAGDVVKGAYKSLEGSMRGTGTYGDVFGVAVGSGAGSMFGEVPEGALRIFGGFRAARDPGVDASGNPLPRSVGADELERFEIDDSQASFNPTRVPQQNMSSLDNRVDRERIAKNPEQYFARLDQVLDHPELFRQYPVLGGLRVVEDTNIDARTGGYYDPTQNLLAVSPNTMKDLNFFKRVIVHEVQHAVQELEGFDQGTNPQSPEVTTRSAAAIKEARKMQDEAAQRFQEFDFESKLDEVRDFIQPLLDDIDAEGFVTADEISFTPPHRFGWPQSLEDLATTLEDQSLKGFDAYDTLLDFYAFVRENPQLIPEESLKDFANTFKISVDELSNLRSSVFIDQFEDLDIVPIHPQRFFFLEGNIRESTYASKSGEVEATNVMDRFGFSLAERFANPPEQSEKIMRAEQWKVPREQPTGFNTGGVVSMEEQMSLFEMGGLADDGAMRDPVSGNEVPPGSMASEVRDDVPSMLSEGEYVVPADVVRYYGVKFFEDLRMGAKSGLNRMEQTGRIGGEPVDSTPGDEPLSPEEMQMLAEISGMYGGGMVRKGYQEGGFVNRPFTPVPNYTTPGFSLFQPLQPAAPPTPAQVTQTEAVTLYGPNGEIATLTLPTDQERYNALIGQGYSTQQQVSQPTVQGGDSNLGGPPDEQDFVFGTEDGPSGFLSQDKFDALNSDPLAFGQSMLDKSDYSRVAGGLGSAVLGPAGGLISGGIAAAITANNVAQAKAAVEIAKSRGLDTTELEKNISTYVSNLPNAARVMAQLVTGDKVVDRFNNQVTQSALTPTPPTAPASSGVTTTIPASSDESGLPGTTSKPATSFYAGLTGAELLPPSRAETERQIQASAQAEANRQYQASRQAAVTNDNDGGWDGFSGVSSGTSSGISSTSAASSGGSSKSSPGASGIGAPGSGGIGKGAGPGGKDVFGPMAKGGLVARPNKNKSLAKKK